MKRFYILTILMLICTCAFPQKKEELLRRINYLDSVVAQLKVENTQLKEQVSNQITELKAQVKDDSVQLAAQFNDANTQLNTQINDTITQLRTQVNDANKQLRTQISDDLSLQNALIKNIQESVRLATEACSLLEKKVKFQEDVNNSQAETIRLLKEELSRLKNQQSTLPAQPTQSVQPAGTAEPTFTNPVDNPASPVDSSSTEKPVDEFYEKD